MPVFVEIIINLTKLCSLGTQTAQYAVAPVVRGYTEKEVDWEGRRLRLLMELPLPLLCTLDFAIKHLNLRRKPIACVFFFFTGRLRQTFHTLLGVAIIYWSCFLPLSQGLSLSSRRLAAMPENRTNGSATDSSRVSLTEHTLFPWCCAVVKFRRQLVHIKNQTSGYSSHIVHGINSWSDMKVPPPFNVSLLSSPFHPSVWGFNCLWGTVSAVRCYVTLQLC